MGVWYCTRADVKSALDSKETARNDAAVDRQIEAASRSIEGLCHRRFYPQAATRYFDWPPAQGTRPWRLWCDVDELVSVSSLSSGGVTIPASDYFLEPVNSGPPFSRIELDLSAGAAFGGGSTHQRAVAVTGVFGYSADEAPAGALAEALDAAETAVDVTDSAAVGVGDVIRVDSERMTVTGASMADTGQDLQVPLSASQADTAVVVTAGGAFAVGETLLCDAERMLVVDIAGNTLVVKRGWDGSVLAAHTGSDVYAPRTLTVTRGVLGTAAAAHSTAALVARHVVPGLVRQLCVAEAVAGLAQEGAGYARVVGAESGQREMSGRGLVELRDRTRTVYGRKARTRVI